MSNSYIGAVQIDSGDQILIGSTLFGTCATLAATAAKQVTLSSFDQLLQGVTVQVKFTAGNTVASGVTLKVNTTDALPVTGNCICEENEVIAFTYENLSGNRYWRSHHNIGGAMPLSGGTFTGAVTLSGAPTDNLHAATKKYVDDKTAGLSGLTGAMHYKGTSSTQITDGGTQNPTINGTVLSTKEAGDVVLYNNQEFVWNESNWELLGDEGSYALKSSTDTITEVSNFTQNTLPTLTVTETETSKVSVTNGSAASLTTNDVTVPNVTAAGTATTASVAGGVLTISIGSAPTIAETPITIKEVGTFTANTPTAVNATTVTVGSASNWSQGTQASLSTADVTVVVPDNSGN